METLLEGVVAAAQPCSLALVVPAVGTTLMGGRLGAVVAAAVWLAATLAAWAQAALLLEVGGGLGAGIVLAVAVLAGLWVLLRDPAGWPSGATRAAGGALVGLGAGLLWRPCVGPQLGEVLTAAPDDPAGQLVRFGAYMAGLLVVTAAVAALPVLHPKVEATLRSPAARLVGAAPVLMLAVVLATGTYASVIGRLVQASGLT